MADLMLVKADIVETYIRTVVGPKCAAFYVLHQKIGQSPILASLLQRSGAWTPDILSEIDSCRARVEDLARTIAGLDSGDLELVCWTRDQAYPPGTAEINRLGVGVWRKGRINEKDAQPGALEWIPLPVLVVLTIVTAGVGAWLLNLHLAGKKISDEADYLRAQTEAQISQAIANAPAADRAGLASAYADVQKAAQSAANQGGKGWLSTMGAGLGQLATAAVETATSLVQSAESWLPWVLGGWMVVQTLGALSNIFGGGGRRCC